MKKLNLIFVFIIATHVLLIASDLFTVKKGTCVIGTMSVLKSSGDTTTYQFLSDSIVLSGNHWHNCGKTTVFEVRKNQDSIIITTRETGGAARCDCNFDFVIKVKATLSDSIVFFNGVKYSNANPTSTITPTITPSFDDSNIDFIPNPSDGKFQILNNSIRKIRIINVCDLNGKVLQEINNPLNEISVLSTGSGIFILDILLDNNIRFYKKVLIK